MSDVSENSNGKGEWMEWVWPGYHWYQGNNPMRAYLEDIPKLGYKFSKMAVTYSEGTEAYYFLLREYEHNGAEFFKVVRKNPDLLFGILEKVDNAAEEIFKLGRKWQNVDFSKLTDVGLLKHHQELFRWDAPLWRFGQIPNLLELHNSFLSEYVKSIIVRNFGKHEVPQLFTIFTTSSYDSITERQDKDFFAVVKKRGDKLKPLDIKTHWEKYTWMTFGWAGPALGYEYFSDNFKEVLKNKRILQKIEESVKFKNNVLRQQRKFLSALKSEDRKFVVLLRTILEQKAKRVDAHSLTYFMAEQMMAEIGRRVGLSLGQMRVVLPEDVSSLFKSVDVDTINKEYKRVMFWYENRKLNKFSGSKAEEKLKCITERLPKVVETRELRGSAAYLGKIKGIVRVILDIKDAPKFKEGEILVTRMTDPSYMFLMKDSSAIITDIGGITCHAAIVSRELKKPCIIGTKIATKVLKDGDMVEVDAERGVVTILKKNQ